MRKIQNINLDWTFAKDFKDYPEKYPDSAVCVDLPHTWNASDGQDGGNDYFRGTCIYIKKLNKEAFAENSLYFLEINGANSSAKVYFNEKLIGEHDGGYSTWRVNLGSEIKEENIIAIVVDNSPNDRVYPQMADFTFYGGLYRNVNLISVPDTHFDLEYFGGIGLEITPKVKGTGAEIEATTFVKNIEKSDKVVISIYDGDGKEILSRESENGRCVFEMEDVHLWNGVYDPYLYRASASIIRDGEPIDTVATFFGCRTFEVDSERGFILNGEEYPLRGVSRHQDRLGIGNALLPTHHEEDMELICEIGCNAVRLAHYQHDRYFYDLCDKKGIIVWAEIPYISRHMAQGRENTMSQMRELIVQNYNHPSIVFWGLSNEITMNGADDPDLIENHKALNDLCHEMDKTRLTTMAVVSMCSTDEKQYLTIPDTVSYNHYFGWYGGDTSMNGPWFDDFHEKYPDIPIGCSEYGCEALNWHTSEPVQGDYTEEYQAHYHEELIRQLFCKKYIYATFVWNMFDFGADARNEGGENGQNHKGLVTFDRKYKKDAFFAYKAWLSDEPFVHICGKRYVDRVEDKTKITVYSNLPSVELYANGQSLGKKKALDHFFTFYVKNVGETKLLAIADGCKDESIIRKVEEFNEDYRLNETGAVLNWFEIEAPHGYLSLNSKMSEIMTSDEGKAVIQEVFAKYHNVNKKGTTAGGFEMTREMLKMMEGFTLIRLTGMLGMMNISFTKEELLLLNKKLNKIKK